MIHGVAFTCTLWLLIFHWLIKHYRVYTVIDILEITRLCVEKCLCESTKHLAQLPYFVLRSNLYLILRWRALHSAHCFQTVSLMRFIFGWL